MSQPGSPSQLQRAMDKPSFPFYPSPHLHLPSILRQPDFMCWLCRREIEVSPRPALADDPVVNLSLPWHRPSLCRIIAFSPKETHISGIGCRLTPTHHDFYSQPGTNLLSYPVLFSVPPYGHQDITSPDPTAALHKAELVTITGSVYTRHAWTFRVHADCWDVVAARASCPPSSREMVALATTWARAMAALNWDSVSFVEAAQGDGRFELPRLLLDPIGKKQQQKKRVRYPPGVSTQRPETLDALALSLGVGTNNTVLEMVKPEDYRLVFPLRGPDSNPSSAPVWSLELSPVRGKGARVFTFPASGQGAGGRRRLLEGGLGMLNIEAVMATQQGQIRHPQRTPQEPAQPSSVAETPKEFPPGAEPPAKSTVPEQEQPLSPTQSQPEHQPPTQTTPDTSHLPQSTPPQTQALPQSPLLPQPQAQPQLYTLPLPSIQPLHPLSVPSQFPNHAVPLTLPIANHLHQPPIPPTSQSLSPYSSQPILSIPSQPPPQTPSQILVDLPAQHPNPSQSILSFTHQPPKDIFTFLPPELLHPILTLLPTPSIASLRLASRAVASLTADAATALPRRFWRSRFGVSFEMGFALPLDCSFPSFSSLSFFTGGLVDKDDENMDRDWQSLYFGLKKAMYNFHYSPSQPPSPSTPPKFTKLSKSAGKKPASYPAPIRDKATVIASLAKRKHHWTLFSPLVTLCQTWCDLPLSGHAFDWITDPSCEIPNTTNHTQIILREPSSPALAARLHRRDGLPRPGIETVCLPLDEGIAGIGVSVVDLAGQKYVSGLRVLLRGAGQELKLGYVVREMETVVDFHPGERWSGLRVRVDGDGVRAVKVVSATPVGRLHVSSWIGGGGEGEVDEGMVQVQQQQGGLGRGWAVLGGFDVSISCVFSVFNLG